MMAPSLGVSAWVWCLFLPPFYTTAAAHNFTNKQYSDAALAALKLTSTVLLLN